MHRTQIMLETDQYQALRERARRSGKSMALIIREILNEGMKSSPPRKHVRARLESFNGFFHDTSVQGRHHDDVLYGGGA